MDLTPSPRKHRLVSNPQSSDSGPPSSTKSNSGAAPGSNRKGFNINLAVSPISISSPPVSHKHTLTRSHSHSLKHRRGSSASTNNPLPQLLEDTDGPQLPIWPQPANEAQGLRYNLELPSDEHLASLDIDDQLKFLALKEMGIVELKDKIGQLNLILHKGEKDLHRLRELVQRSLYKEMSAGYTGSSKHVRQSSNPRDEAIASTKNRTRRRTLSSSSSPSKHLPVPEHPEPDSKSRLWSNLSKPLGFIQQFDSMLQNEFERSLIPQSLNPQPRTSEESYQSPLRSRSKNNDVDLPAEWTSLRSLLPQRASRNPEEMFQAVSSSIWSFVNDVRENMLPPREEEEQPKDKDLYNLDNGSTVSVENLNNSDYDVETTMETLPRRRLRQNSNAIDK